MICAYINAATGEVLNNIEAELDAPVPEGIILVAIPDMFPVSAGWAWDGTSFIQPDGTPFVLPEPTRIEIEVQDSPLGLING